MGFLCDLRVPVCELFRGGTSHQQLIPSHPQDFHRWISLANNSLTLFSTFFPATGHTICLGQDQRPWSVPETGTARLFTVRPEYSRLHRRPPGLP
jgi:hypothetical protein